MSLMQMSLAGGRVILAAILIRWMGRDRLPLGTFSALWALAALRLTVPAGLPFRFSAWALLPRRQGRELVPESVYGHIIRLRLYDARPEFAWLREKAYA